MNIKEEYAEMMARKYRNAVVTPLAAAWEFMPRPANADWERDWSTIHKMALRYRWSLGIDLRNILKEQQKTIIVTDSNQVIQFVSHGFETMTGYATSEAVGRKPNFLQGADTDPNQVGKIRESVQARKPVSASLLNYKKDGTPYWCKVDIVPVFNTNQKLVHFMAIEKQVSL